MRADIHDGQEHECSIHGPDTEAQDQSPSSLKSGLQHTAGPYSWVKTGRVNQPARTAASPLIADIATNFCRSELLSAYEGKAAVLSDRTLGWF